MAKKLTVLQERFIQNLLTGMDQTKAYIEAGYKARKASARANSSRLLSNVSIRDALEKGRKKAQQRVDLTVDRILKEECCLGFFDPAGLVDENGKLLDPHKLPEQVRRAIVGLEVVQLIDGSLKFKYKFSDKGRSLERLSRHLGMYNDKLNLSLSKEVLDAILSGLPDDYADGVRRALTKIISGK